MAFTLFPKAIRFFDMLIEQNQILKMLQPISKVFLRISPQSTKHSSVSMSKRSKQGLLALKIAGQLSQTFITPIHREDIYRITLAQEDSINFFKTLLPEPESQAFPLSVLALKMTPTKENGLLYRRNDRSPSGNRRLFLSSVK